MEGTFQVQGYPGAMVKVVSSDVAQSLPSSLVVRSDKNQAIGITITNEAHDLRVAWDGTAPTTVTGHLLSAGQSLRLENAQAIRQFQFISKTMGSHGTLHVSPEYPSPAYGAY